MKPPQVTACSSWAEKSGLDPLRFTQPASTDYVAAIAAEYLFAQQSLRNHGFYHDADVGFDAGLIRAIQPGFV